MFRIWPKVKRALPWPIPRRSAKFGSNRFGAFRAVRELRRGGGGGKAHPAAAGVEAGRRL